MHTIDTVFLGIIAVTLSVYFIFMTILAAFGLKLLQEVKEIVHKADNVLDSVESAAEVFQETQGRLTLFKLIRNIYKKVSGSHKK